MSVEKNANVQVKKLKNVYDKEQLYVVTETEKGKVIINVGNKSANAVEELMTPADSKTI